MTQEYFLELMKKWNIPPEKYCIALDISARYERKAWQAYVLEQVADRLYSVYYFEKEKYGILYFNNIEDAYFTLACLLRCYLDSNRNDIVI